MIYARSIIHIFGMNVVDLFLQDGFTKFAITSLPLLTDAAAQECTKKWVFHPSHRFHLTYLDYKIM